MEKERLTTYYTAKKEDLEQQGQGARQRDRDSKNTDGLQAEREECKNSGEEPDREGKNSHRLQGREREDLKDGDREPLRARWKKEVQRRREKNFKNHSSVGKRGGQGRGRRD